MAKHIFHLIPHASGRLYLLHLLPSYPPLSAVLYPLGHVILFCRCGPR